MANIYLFRHGQTEHNLKEMFTGWETNTVFSPTGLLQNQHLAKLLKDIRLDLAIHSRLTRSLDTLNTVLTLHPECKDIRLDDRMIERNYGVLNSTAHADLVNSKGKDFFNKIHRGWDEKAEGGESYADVEIRVAEFITWLKNNYAGKDINIAISAHGNSIRIFRHILESPPKEVTCSWILTFATVFAYQL